MGYKLIALETAQREYDSILYYLAEVLKSPHAAAAFHHEFTEKLRTIVETPEAMPLSHNEKLATKGYRTLRVKRYIALYRIDGNAVVLEHIFHQTQSYARYV